MDVLQPVDEAAPSLEEALSAAYDASDAGDASPSLNAQPGERPAPAPAPQPQQPAQAAQPAGEPQRDAQGRFVPKAPETGQPNQQPGAAQPLAAGGPAQAQTTAPPLSWSAPAKAEFAKLSPTIQQEVLKREGEIAQGKLEWEQKAERFNRLDSILAPRRDQIAMAGSDEAGYVQRLFAAEDVLRRTPVDGILYLGQQYGVNWNQLLQRLSGSPAAQQPQLPPQLQPLMQQVQSLTQTVQQQQRATQQSHLDEATRHIAAFGQDPANVYFENVRGDMAKLMANGQATNLKEAYEAACWARSDIRPLMIQAQSQEQQRQAQETAKAKAAAARQASGSVTGSPTPGARAAGPKQTLDDALSEAWDAAAA